MGRMLVAHVMADADLELCGALEAEASPFLGQDAAAVAGLQPCGVTITADAQAAFADADAVIDFTFAPVTMALAPQAAAAGLALVIGTTGLTPENKAALKGLADHGARIVCTPNMSVGVNLLFALCDKVARTLGPDYDMEVVEMHHNRKKDAPSGTAERIGEILAAAAGLDYATDTRHGRVGNVGARTKREIGMHSLRGGDVVGDHTVIFAADGERVELTHKASSRDCFANGAVRAVKFLQTAVPGMYDMQDVLGLR